MKFRRSCVASTILHATWNENHNFFNWQSSKILQQHKNIKNICLKDARIAISIHKNNIDNGSALYNRRMIIMRWSEFSDYITSLWMPSDHILSTYTKQFPNNLVDNTLTICILMLQTRFNASSYDHQQILVLITIMFINTEKCRHRIDTLIFYLD